MKLEIIELEKAISELPAVVERDADMHPTRGALMSAIRAVCTDSEFGKGLSIADHIEIAADDNKGKRLAGLLVLRCFGVPRLIPENNSENQISRKICSLSISGLGDFGQWYEFSSKSQTYETYGIISGIHDDIYSRLENLRNVGASPESFLSSREKTMSILNSKIIKSYLQAYDVVEVTNWIDAVFNLLNDVLDANLDDHNKIGKFSDLKRVLRTSPLDNEMSETFLCREFVKPFLESLSSVVKQLDAIFEDRFRSSISKKISGTSWIEKRFPILEQGREFQILFPFTNEGPGIATNLTAQVVSENEGILLNDRPVPLGNVRPGTFVIAEDFLVAEPCSEVTVSVFVSWEDMGGSNRQEECYSAIIRAQDPNIDWVSLELMEPYSTAAAEGEDFIGREEKVIAISQGLTRRSGQSAYISGQKRIGKTSLGLAVRDYISQASDRELVHIFYTEWGEFSASSSEQCIVLLGGLLSDFLDEYIEDPLGFTTDDFKGTLSPLSRSAKRLLQERPDDQFVFIIDEFDEIHTDMYRYGPLAEAFFANLRTLSGAKNIGLILIGGENMPFIISAQGDQLNRFIPYPLDYFDKEREWDDFKKMTVDPVAKSINWYESALVRLFDQTNGHPYFTKLVCSRIYRLAVSTRDTEITAHEVDRAVNELATDLDTNSFSHIWKDGINTKDFGEKYKEVIALQRCRVLVSIARLLREGSVINSDNIVIKKNSSELTASDVQHTINEFCRRDILEELETGYKIKIGLFEEWLKQTGISKIIADTIGDEYRDEIDRIEEEAYVKSDEISKLVESWPSYQAQRITTDQVRDWMEQVESNQDRRLLFDLLGRIRFVSEEEIRILFGEAKGRLQEISEFVTKKKIDRRQDIVVTYVDGPGKSGAGLARSFAEANSIGTKCVFEMGNFKDTLEAFENETNHYINGIVIVDDFAGTGTQLSQNLSTFFEQHDQLVADRNLVVLVYLLVATAEGEENVRKSIANIAYPRVDLKVCELLNEKHFAFQQRPGIWGDPDKYDQAQSLCNRIGTQLSKNAPLGYGGQGLLLTFTRNCPNNSLPILHKPKASVPWNALFKRTNI